MTEVKHAESEAPTLELPELGAEIERMDAPMATPEEITAEAILRLTDAPTQTPPSAAATVGEDEGVAAWHNGRKIVALWCSSSARNAFISVPGLGWKKLSNANDSSFLNMTMMASHAEQTNANVNTEVGADGAVHTMYVW